MRVLIVAKYKKNGFSPFIEEQAKSLSKKGIEILFYPIKGKGIKGYIREVIQFRKTVAATKPDIIHAHYGICGLFSNLQRSVPVVTTYHGSDINKRSVLPLSKIAMKKSAFNIFVSASLFSIAKPSKNYAVIPCGIIINDYPLVEKAIARKQMGLEPERKYVLFAGAFSNPVKNASLARKAVTLLQDVELLELKGYSRKKVGLLMQAVDAFLMTSHTEGSPQVIKESIVCGCPVVSVDVGDVKDVIAGIQGCYLTSRHPAEIAEKLKQAIAFGKTDGREIIVTRYDSGNIADRIIEIYKQLS